MTSSNPVKDIHCFLHPEREAVAICLSCGQYFCRECVTEHQGKVLCKACLSRQGHKSKKRKKLPLFFRAFIAMIVGLILCYILFYSLGYTLSIIPDTFHQGTYFEKK